MEFYINKECFKDKAYSIYLKDGDSCFECEFCTSIRVGLGGVESTDISLCEKGYWKEEI